MIIVGKLPNNDATQEMEYLLDDHTENDPLKFSSYYDAVTFLLELGYTAEGIKEYTFQRVLLNPKKGTLQEHLYVMELEEHLTGFAAYLSNVLCLDVDGGTEFYTEELHPLWQSYYLNVLLKNEACKL